MTRIANDSGAAASLHPPRRVVAIGGGTGLPAVLRGLREVVHPDSRDGITAVVTMTDDGGSSGRLRRSMGVPPPGDVRNCLVALAEEQDLLAGLFQHRFETCKELGGHSVGNLILAALAEKTGSFLEAVELSSHVLRTRGRILPATHDDVQLHAVLADGTRVSGETRIAEVDRPIRRIELHPGDVKPSPGVEQAILEADLVVIGPGSLFTSLLPNLAIPALSRALRRTRAVVVWVANLVSERGSAADLGLSDHLRMLHAHAGGPVISGALIHEGPIDASMVERYREEGAVPMSLSGADEAAITTVRHDLIDAGRKLRHDPHKTARGLIETWSRAGRATTVGGHG